MPTLILTLPPTLPTAASPCSAVWTEDGQTVKSHVDAPLALLPDTRGAEIVVRIAVTQLSWHRLTLPRGTLERNIFQESNTARLRSVIEGLLEERVLDEPQQLHFALEPQARSGEPIWVAVCDRAWLHAWLNALEQAGWPVSRIVPELAPAATDAEPACALHLTGGTPQGAQMAYATPRGVAVLPLTQHGMALVAPAPGGESAMQVVAEPGVVALAEQHFQGRVRLQTAPQRAVLSAQSDWDLAQFDLLRTRGTRLRKRLSSLGSAVLQSPQWRPARWALVALLLVNLVGLQMWAWREQAALTAKRTAMRDILTTTFPDVRLVVDAPLQMARSLADLQRQSGSTSSGDLEPMLGIFQTVAPELAAPTALEFAAGELRLKVADTSAAALSGLAAKLQAHGYTAVLEGDRLVLKQERRP